MTDRQTDRQTDRDRQGKDGQANGSFSNCVVSLQEADKGMALVPKDNKLHFILTLDAKGLIRFQAVAGDQRYLAFGSTGEQVKVIGKDVKSGDKSKQQQTLFSFSPV